MKFYINYKTIFIKIDNKIYYSLGFTYLDTYKERGNLDKWIRGNGWNKLSLHIFINLVNEMLINKKLPKRFKQRLNIIFEQLIEE